MTHFPVATSVATTDPPRIWRTTVVATMVYGFLYSVFCLWMLVTWRADSFHSQVLGVGLLGVPLVHVFTGLNIAWLVVLSFDLREALRIAAPLRRAQAVGVALSIVVLLAMEVSVFAMHDAALAWAPH